MNKLVQSIEKEDNKTTTQNGMKIKKSSQDALVDLFYAIGALRGNPQRAVELFQKAFNANKEMAVRIALYARDVRGGMGERENFRQMMKDFAIRDFKNAKKVIPLIPEVGRWDDLFVFIDTPVEKEALDFYAKALKDAKTLRALRDNLDNMSEEECKAIYEDSFRNDAYA